LKTLIIAEAGINHNGSLDLAKQLVDVAVNAKADFIKFQSFITEKNITSNAKKADYQLSSTDRNESQFDMIKKLELNYEDHKKLIGYCKKSKIQFLSTAFDKTSLDMLNNFDLPFFKIASGEITNLPFLRYIAGLGKPIVLSTGMSNMQEVESAITILEHGGMAKEDITILHCNTEYPTPIKDVNLKAMLTIRDTLKIKVGYSDHTDGIEIAIAAAAMGACIIEKHFTLDRNLPGPDHIASLEPNELKNMVKAIRNIEKAIGDGEKIASESEIKNISIARKSIVAKTLINKGELFTEDNLTVKRPGTGISPMKWDSLVGKLSKKKYMPDDLI
tara:strand:- start:164 stop:1159 length:996 start_codon:yes stop_codon:yes gene_type:complete